MCALSSPSSVLRAHNIASQTRIVEGHFLCPNCIRRPVDCILRGQFSPELAANFMCRGTGEMYVDSFRPSCVVGHMAKYCPLGDAGCPWCVEAGANCSACALATARPFVNVAAVNTVFKVSNAEGRRPFARFAGEIDSRVSKHAVSEGKTRRKEMRIQREKDRQVPSQPGNYLGIPVLTPITLPPLSDDGHVELDAAMLKTYMMSPHE